MRINCKILGLVSDVIYSSRFSPCLHRRFVCKKVQLANFNPRNYSSNQTVKMEETVTNPSQVPLSDDVGQFDCKRKCDDESESVAEKKLKTETDLVRVKHKKFAILISYCGVNYYGLQRNNDVKTIEGDLFDAFLKLNLIKQEHYERPQEFYFQRAARTDKGVSAIKQILSCRMPESFQSSIPEINALLPPMIRVIAAKKTTLKFDCKNYCDGRTYAYLMPSYALAPLEEKNDLSYRIKLEHIDRFNQILKKYEGTHNFFNFTSQKTSVDPSAMRFIIKMECSQPFIRKDLEFVQIHVRGQSFMMHQIRKMIGLAIGIMKGFANEEVIDRAFGLVRLDIPKAPGLGLMLEEVHYDKYNKRFSGDGIHEALVWDEYNDVIKSFVEQFIYPVIIDTEINELSMMKWLQLLPIHTFTEREPGPPAPIDDSNPDVPERSVYLTAASNVGLISRQKETTTDAIKDAKESFSDTSNSILINEKNSST
ncbi:pseudouridylate synthase 1 homolog isoform X2 [Panonychus citri]|uniref:pseudouridylate synthase 1 homolog isoform X2 n=1 Tax=Panonychus citri TaxID=50023 RepID=UPI002307C4D7|nr:pseudouridylate synthase 1 homolog isoform X2 [Panonychus citri]